LLIFSSLIIALLVSKNESHRLQLGQMERMLLVVELKVNHYVDRYHNIPPI